jgi:hypothetical protein
MDECYEELAKARLKTEWQLKSEEHSDGQRHS